MRMPGVFQSIQPRPKMTTTKTNIATALLGLIAFLALSGANVVQGQTGLRSFSLDAITPAFWNLFDHKAKLTTVASGFGFTEGPVWDPAGFLWVSDEKINQIFKVTLATGQKQAVIALGDPDGNTYDQQHRLLDCASVLRAVIRLSSDGTHYETLTERYQGKRYNSPNDVVLGPDGAIYFTDPTSDLPPGQKQEIPFQGVYRLAADGQVTLLTRELASPNGLAFSPDGKKFYVDDSDKQNIRVYDFKDGHISNGRIFGEEPGNPDDGVPDGMRVDTRGNLYVTGPKGVWIWDPAGHHIGTIVVPEQPANLAWGDPDFGTLYLTATTSVYKIRTRAHGFIPYQ